MPQTTLKVTEDLLDRREKARKALSHVVNSSSRLFGNQPPSNAAEQIRYDVAYTRAKREWEAADLTYHNAIEALANENDD